MEKIKQCKNFICKHHRKLAIGLIGICLISIYFFILYKICIDHGYDALSTAASFSADVATVIATGVAILSVLYFAKDYSKKHEYNQIENAIELTRYYKEDILTDLSYVAHVLSKSSNHLSTINAVPRNNFINFTNGEFNDLKSSYNIMTKKEILNDLTTKILIDAKFNFTGKLIIQVKTNPEKDLQREMLIGEFMLKLSDTLNSLEYFSMKFNLKTASECVAFPSLHQTYIKHIRLLYPFIAELNTSPSDKCYTNIIQLFNKWNNIDIENKNKEREAINKANSAGQRKVKAFSAK